MPTMQELKGEFIRYEAGTKIIDTGGSIDDAQGVMFKCPACYAKNGGIAGTHSVICWSRSRGVPEDAEPGPGRWTLHGTGMDDLTLEGDPVGTARSVQLNGGCNWHGFVTNGVAE